MRRKRIRKTHRKKRSGGASHMAWVRSFKRKGGHKRKRVGRRRKAY
jgi:hypothetical protein